MVTMRNVLSWALYARVSVEQVAVGRKCFLGEKYSESSVVFEVDHLRRFEVCAEQLLGWSAWCTVMNNWRLHLFFWRSCWIFVQLYSGLCTHLPSCSVRKLYTPQSTSYPSSGHIKMQLEVNQIELLFLLPQRSLVAVHSVITQLPTFR